MNLNHIFLFVAVISPLLVLARAWRPGTPYHGWRVCALVVLAITGIAWLVRRDIAGYVGAAGWFVLLFIPTIGLRKMTELAARRNYRAAVRLGTALQILHPTSELREEVELFRSLASRTSVQTGFTSVTPAQSAVHRARFTRFRYAPTVFILILLNAVGFVLENSAGDWHDPEILQRIGALDPDLLLVQHEYWRLFTALFLHAGLMHLLFNLFALYVVGPPLEHSIGTTRFALCYLISGIASGAGVVGLMVTRLIQPAQLIGASGSIMGIVGAWAGFLLRHRHAPDARQRLQNIGLIVVIQIAFDLSTPQVSMAAHMCGLGAGFFLGLVLAPRSEKVP